MTYTVDALDRVTALQDVPQSSVGAPLPTMVADEHRVWLAFYLQNTPEAWDGSNARVVGRDSPDEPCALVRFDGVLAHQSGWPNDEVFSAHPLYGRGLRPFGTYEVHDSSWLRVLERRNSAHPHHSRERFFEHRHFIFAFHDTTFECLAHGYTVKRGAGPLIEMVREAVGNLAI